MATTKLVTAEDLEHLADDGAQYELIKGVLTQMPPASHRHSVLAAWIVTLLNMAVRPRKLGNVSTADGGYILRRNPDIVVAPDAAFVRADRLPSGDMPTYLELAPDLVVEVISPSDRFTDLNDKVALYLDAGVQIVWVVDPHRKQVSVYSQEHPYRTLTSNDILDGGDVLRDFSVQISELFDE